MIGFGFWAMLATGLASDASGNIRSRGFMLPEQVTAEAQPLTSVAVSPDGKLLAYASKREKFTDIWLRSADPAIVMLPRRLTRNPSVEMSPAFSRDGKKLAFVGTSQDVKGDIYVLDVANPEAEPTRLTGSHTEDGAPCFSPDGTKLYFHTRQPGDAGRQIAVIQIGDRPRSTSALPQPAIIPVEGDGSFPAVSPDGSELVFVTHRADPSGDIFRFNFSNSSVQPLTSGPQIDQFPAWSVDGNAVYFSRTSVDTNFDGTIDERDNSAIYRVETGGDHLHEFPLTSLRYSASRPLLSQNRFFFLSRIKGVTNAWFLPLDGQVITVGSAKQQIQLADDLFNLFPNNPYPALLGYYRVLEKFPHDRPSAATAAYRIGGVYLDLNLPDQSKTIYQWISRFYGEQIPQAPLAHIRQTVIQIQQQLKNEPVTERRLAIVRDGISKLDTLNLDAQPQIAVRSRIETARLLSTATQTPDVTLKAIALLGGVIQAADSPPDLIAEAMTLKADLFARIGVAQQVYPSYLAVVQKYPDIRKWADKALDRVLAIIISGDQSAALDDKIDLLRKIARDHQTKTPMLSMGALNRLGDLFFNAGEWSKAKPAYRQVIEQFSVSNTQTAAARLALAEILYREERFREALDLYEAEITLRPQDDHIRRLAREGYIQKSLVSAEYLYGLGEVVAAKNRFKQLIDYDDTIVASHRGYIKSAVALNDLKKTLGVYENRLGKNPEDVIAVYGTALCLTYVENRAALERARGLLYLAININGQIEYFHQALGYTLEVLETAHREKGGLELALESYQKAYFLNNRQSNPVNTAALLLNLGNIHFLMGQHAKAFYYYRQRLDTQRPFHNDNAAILFYRRLGTSAFQVQETGKTVEAFTKALTLIEEGITPQAATFQFDLINRYVIDQTLQPLLNSDGFSKQAKALVRSQSDVSRELSRLTHVHRPPPSKEWNAYKAGIRSLVREQKRINRQVISLLERFWITGASERPNPETARPTLDRMINRVLASINHTERLIRLRAEMFDRLGLAHQDSSAYEPAIQAYGRAFETNQKLGMLQNLARNKRSVAYNRYLLAGTVSGAKRVRVLKQAETEFNQVLGLLKAHGTSGPRAQDKSSLFRVNVQMSLEETGSTLAGKGFSLDQETRLAEAFVARINLELGRVTPAAKAINAQLAFYPPETIVQPGDIYGVSVLAHRAGHLSRASGNPLEAIKAFHRAATLSMDMKNPVSTGINLTNMAKLLAEVPLTAIGRDRLVSRFEALDRQLAGLFLKNRAVSKPMAEAAYHNRMGIYAPAIWRSASQGLRGDVVRARGWQHAVSHFTAGIQLLEKNPGDTDREELALMAALHLNMANAVIYFGNQAKEDYHLKKALDLSKQGFFPDIQWRAYAGMNRFDQALETLEAVTVLRAGCGAGEITGAFESLILSLLDQQKIEVAFNLIEHLAELERYHRLAPLIGDLTVNEKSRFTQIFKRLDRIAALRKQISTAKKDDISYLEERMANEQALLADLTGQAGEKLPGFIRLVSDRRLQEEMMALLGIAAEAESIADGLVKSGSDTHAGAGLTRYGDLIQRYVLQRDRVLSNPFAALSTGPLSLFGPETFEAIDVMENLPADGTLLRLYGPLQPTGQSEPAYYLFILTPDNLTLRGPAPMKALLEALPATDHGRTYLVYDQLENLTATVFENEQIDAFALSAGHFIRSNLNKKPFKKSVLAVPGISESITGYELINRTDIEGDSITSLSKGIHTLLLAGRTHLSYTVPTRPGETPKMMFVTDSEGERHADMLDVMTHLSQLSLALLPGAALHQAYPIGHLFSIYGCPTVILPYQAGDAGLFIPVFLKTYQTASAAGALSRLRPKTGPKPPWLVMGHGGMSPEAADQYAKKHFAAYVKRAKQAYDSDQPGEAMALFENALQIATESEAFKSYLPPLYAYARESAHQASNGHKAIGFASALAGLMAEVQPDTAAHGESLLRLGLLHARLEQFSSAVGRLNEAVEIFTALELDPQKIEALSGLGTVFEQATEYDRAIGSFQSALVAGDAVNQKKLLAGQYTSIGRINDLRLSRYALAIENYQKALDLYRQMDPSPQNRSHTAQALLNIGRSHRLTGNFTKADRFYSEAMKIADAIESDHHLRAKIVIEQANNAWYQARYADAFALQRRTYRIAVENRLPRMQVISLNTAGLIWWALGDYEKALSELNQALSIAQQQGVSRGEIATTFNNIGLIYREMGRFEEALETFDRALAIDRKIKSRWGVAYDLRHKGITRFKMGEPERAAALLKDALHEARSIGNRINESKTLLNLGDVYFSVQNRKEAEAAYQEALKLSQRMSIHEIKWRALYGLANLRLPDRPRDAEQLLKEAIDVIERIRGDIKITRLRENFLFNKLMVYETLCRLLADSGNVSGAFEIAERSRSRNFIDLLGNQRLSLNQNIDQGLYDRQAALRERIAEQLALVAQSTDTGEQKTYEKMLVKLENDLDNVMHEIEQQNPHLLSMVSVRPVDVKELMTITGSETALVVYYLLADEVFCWVIGDKSIELFRTPMDRSSLGEMILDFRRRIQNLEPLDDLSKKLHETLVAPVAARLSGMKQVGIVPHGYLHYLSFATLSDGAEYFIDRFPLFYIPSASVLKYTFGKRSGEKNPRVLAIGNPDLGDPAFDLPFAEHEVDSIKWNFSKITTLTQERATEKWVVDHINEYGIIHLASHGEFDPINPLFSAIKLSKDRELDGDLAASEIFGLKITADLVVLSACQTGLGKLTPGDDVIGLTRAFLYAGTHTLISTLWRVSDISTAILIKNFYRRYVKLNKAESLRQSMLHVKNRYPHPGYWGAFTLVGDYL